MLRYLQQGHARPGNPEQQPAGEPSQTPGPQSGASCGLPLLGTAPSGCSEEGLRGRLTAELMPDRWCHVERIVLILEESLGPVGAWQQSCWTCSKCAMHVLRACTCEPSSCKVTAAGLSDTPERGQQHRCQMFGRWALLSNWV